MKKLLCAFFAAALSLSAFAENLHRMKSIQEYGVLPENTPQQNKANLQKAIDEASLTGSALYVEPVKLGYPVESGIILRKNVSLIGVHGPVGRGTQTPNMREPAGSVFRITDTKAPFITVESATQIRGIQFYYPDQPIDALERIKEYPATIQRDKKNDVEGVTLSCLTFYGEYTAMDFTTDIKSHCEQILFEHCYGYPLGGEFIKINRCTDIPRFLHCHVNPANLRQFRGGFSRATIDSVIAKKKFAYYIEGTDNAQLVDVFTFGSYGGIFLGKNTYGQLTNFNLDCVCIGILKEGSQNFNRNWMIAQGSIIANAGDKVEDVHPFLIRGTGHTAITNVEAFSGKNGALTAIGKSYDFITIEGEGNPTVSLFGCRMRNYVAENPITIKNRKAKVRAVACVDNKMEFFDFEND